MMKEVDYREIANAKIGSRLRQVILLLIVILVGILISVSSEAGTSKSNKSKNAASEISKQASVTEDIVVTSSARNTN